MTPEHVMLAYPALAVALAVLVWPGKRPRWRLRLSLRQGARQEAETETEPGVDETLQHLALALHAGAGLQPALREVAAASPGATGTELMAVAAAMAWGLDDDAAWGHAPDRWDPARRSLMLAARSGVAPSPMLRAAASDLRRERDALVQESTAQLSVRLVLPLGLAFLPAFVLTTVVPVVLALAATVLDLG
ncbi:MAG: type II secretion system F family protein [Ornithinimicrobium sp.]